MKKKLKDICSMIHRGKTPKYVEESNVLVFAQKCNLQTGGIDLNKCLCLDTTNLKKWTTEDYLHKNDIVINSTGTGTLGRVGFFDIDSEKPVVPDTHVTVVRVSDKETYSKWVYYFLKYSQNYLISKGHGSTKQQELATSEIEKIEIPLPSYAYQENGAYYLDSIQSAIDNKKQQLQQLDELVKSKFVEMFGDPLLESGKKFSECVIINPQKTEIDYFTDDLEVSFLAMPSVSETGDIDNSIIRPYSEVKKGFTYFYENDVLFAKITPCMENGKGAVAKGLKNQIGFGSTEFHVLRPIKNISNPYWIYYLMSFKDFRVYAEKKMTGSAGQKRVPVSFFDQVYVNLPSIELQNTFAEYVQKIDSAKSIIKTQLNNLNELLESKMDFYFGE